MAAQRAPSGTAFWPDYFEERWDLVLNAGLGSLAACAAVAGLNVFPSAWSLVAGVPTPAGLGVAVFPGSYLKKDGRLGTYAGTGGSPATVAAGTTFVWINTSGALVTGPAFPAAGNYVPLAVVTASSTDVTSVLDVRLLAECGDPGPTLPEATADPPMGVATLAAGSAVVTNARVTANSRVFLSVQSPGGAQGFLSVARVPGTSFTINSTSATDTSDVAWLIVEPVA